MTKMEQLRKWISEEICKFVTIENLIDDDSGEGNDDYQKWVFKIYTDKHYYQIVAIDRNDDEGYLGCQVSDRKARAGESWLRGSDLHDGKFTRGCWEKIKDDIISCELVPLADRTRQIPIEEE